MPYLWAKFEDQITPSQNQMFQFLVYSIILETGSITFTQIFENTPTKVYGDSFWWNNRSQKRHLPPELDLGSGTRCVPSNKKKGINLRLQVQISHPTQVKFKFPHPPNGRLSWTNARGMPEGGGGGEGGGVEWIIIIDQCITLGRFIFWTLDWQIFSSSLRKSHTS